MHATRVDHTNTICYKCGGKTSGNWYRYYDDKGRWNKGLYICNACHGNLPDSLKNARKSLANFRIRRTIGFDKFDDLNTHEKGRIIEYIVVTTYGIKNHNDEMDNFQSAVDAIHPEYGRLQIKGASLNIIEGKWQRGFRDTEILWPEFDFMIFVCMDEHKPWKNVVRVYKIPQEEFANRKSIAIVKDPSRGPIWCEIYRIDEKPFNDVWHKVLKEGCIQW